MDPQEDDEVKLAFQEWKKTWKKEYATPDEEKTRFETFVNNYRSELKLDPPSEPLWTVLNEYADLPLECHFGYIRLDDGFDSDAGDEDATLYFKIRDQKKNDTQEEDQDASVKHQSTVPPAKHTSDHDKDDTKEEDQDASVKHQSTVLPAKRTSDHDKDDTKEDQDASVKHRKIDCGGQKRGCCSDCRK